MCCIVIFSETLERHDLLGMQRHVGKGNDFLFDCQTRTNYEAIKELAHFKLHRLGIATLAMKIR